MAELEHWEGRFSGPEYFFGTEPNIFLKGQAHRLRPGQKLLAVADGEGRNGVWLAGQGVDVLAIDFSPAALAKSRKLAAARGVSLRTEQADLSDWQWPVEAFDVVAAIFIQFAPPPLRDRIFAGMRRTLKPRGLLLMQGYRPEQLRYRTGGPAQVENLYTRALLEQAFGDWDMLELHEHDDEIHEGAGHGGMSALIDLVVRKPSSGIDGARG